MKEEPGITKSVQDQTRYFDSETPGITVKPPLGPIPRFVWIGQRIKDLSRAINENMCAEGNAGNLPEWSEELSQLCREYIMVRHQRSSKE